ncbi:hypothetical protein [Microcoleus sp. AT3-D2]|uniref:hypothetical protein n=1 Tax=Microcoleus sp. AT3-D2 TaxID=2818612 RepID=UPI002FD23ECE
MDNTLKLWDLTTGTEFKTLTGHTAYINAIAITWTGKWLFPRRYDNTLKVWDERKWGGAR